MDFVRLIGKWILQWTGYDDERESGSATGSLIVESILDGRAVRDEWRVLAAEPPFHGTTVRFYDTGLGAWRSTWIEPINGRIRRFIGRSSGSDMVLISTDEQPHLRWRFTEVTDDSFTWIGERSSDEGRTWVREEQMRAYQDHDRTGRS